METIKILCKTSHRLGCQGAGTHGTGPFRHQRRNLISVGLSRPQISKQGTALGRQLKPSEARRAGPATDRATARLGWRLQPLAVQTAVPTGTAWPLGSPAAQPTTLGH